MIQNVYNLSSVWNVKQTLYFCLKYLLETENFHPFYNMVPNNMEYHYKQKLFPRIWTLSHFELKARCISISYHKTRNVSLSAPGRAAWQHYMYRISSLWKNTPLTTTNEEQN